MELSPRTNRAQCLGDRAPGPGSHAGARGAGAQSAGAGNLSLMQRGPAVSLCAPTGARGLEDARPPQQGRRACCCTAGQQQSHRDAQPGTATPESNRGAAGSGSLATCIRALKGHLHGPNAVDMALACQGGQACVLFFGVQALVFAGIHIGQLLSEARFVSFPDRPLPHNPPTLRWVRVLDTVCSLCLGLVYATLAVRLRRKTISGYAGRNVLLQTLASLSAIYAVGALIDYVQCHYQGGGIGPHCHGYNCLQTSIVLAATAAVGEYQPRFFCGACFGGQGLYRLCWVMREKRELWVSVAVLVTSSMLLLFPAVLYVEDIVQWEIGRSKRSEQAAEANGVQSELTLRAV